MTTLSNMERMNLSNSKALRRAREQLKITNVKLARRLEPKSAHKHLKRILVTFLLLKIPNPFLLTGLLWPKSFFVSSYHRNFVSRESMIARKEVLEGAPLPSTGV